MTENIFLQISVLLSITVSIAFIIGLLRQPLMMAYILAGIVCGPIFLNLLQGDANLYEALAQFGIVLLLFMVGLSLNFTNLQKMGKVAVVIGLGQFLITGVIGGLIMLLSGLSLQASIYIGIAITFSSTIVIFKLLNDKKEHESIYGRYTIALMLVQDLIAIAILVILGIMKEGGTLGATMGLLSLKILLIGSTLYLFSRSILPRLLQKVAHSGEFLFLFTITWCFAVASVIYALGFSIEIGALMAGLSLGSSPYQTEIVSRIKPLRDFFLILFFVILGSEMSIASTQSILIPGLILSAFVLIGKPIILYLIFRGTRFMRKNSFFAALTAAQVSEFGFIMLFTGNHIGQVNDQTLTIFTMSALISLFISSYLITYNEKFYLIFKPFFKLFGKDKYHQKNNIKKNYDIWVFGYHRIGKKVVETLSEQKMEFAVVDYNPETIKELQSLKIDSYFGDAGDVEFLEMLTIQTAKLIILTIPDPDDQSTLINYVRRNNPNAKIIANLYSFHNADNLYKAGADFVMIPHLLGGQWFQDFLKTKKKLTKKTFKNLRESQQKEMQITLVSKNL